MVRKIENILIKSRKFSLPGKKELLAPTLINRDVVVDVMECSIERPSHKQKDYYSGKQKEHTLKFQVLIERETKRIICARAWKRKNS